MKPSDQDRLLRELLDDESLEGLRRATLAQGLAHLRARRRRRAALSGAAGVVALVVVTAIAFRPAAPAPLAAVAPTRATVSEVKEISDAELFALFPGRAMALIGPPGRQQFVFLDRPDLATSGASAQKY